MECLNEITGLLYADGELTEHETRRIREHLTSCPNCRSMVASMEEENRALRNAFHAETFSNASQPVPHLPQRVVAECIFVVLGIAVALRTAMSIIAGVEFPAPLDWLNPIGMFGSLNYLLASIVYLIEEGSSMITAWVGSMTFLVAVGIVCFAALELFRRFSRAGIGGLLACLAVVAVLPPDTEAADIRSSRSGALTIASDEVVDDTLIAFAESIVVDGTINGDLIAWGRRITVNGLVAGDVIAGGQNVLVTGTVQGNILGFGQTVDARGSVRNVYGFGQSVSVGSQQQTAGNAILFGQTLDVEGDLARGLIAFGRSLEVRGNVGTDVTFYGRNLTLLAPSRVGGNLTATVPSRDLVVVADGATVVGQTDIRLPEPRPSRYATIWFYLFQTIRLGAAFATGMLLFWLVPALWNPNLNNRLALLRAAGAGFVAMVVTPVAAVLVGLTLIGVPVAIVMFAGWLLALYLAKIVVAAFLGRTLLSSGGTSMAMALFAGLVIIIVAINLPFIGGLVNLLLTVIGLGAIVMVGYREWGQRRLSPTGT